MVHDLPPLSELADDLCVCVQFGAERMALTRHLINEAGETGLTLRKLEAEDRRLVRLTHLGVIVFRLVPHEDELRRLVGRILAGGGPPDRGLRVPATWSG